VLPVLVARPKVSIVPISTRIVTPRKRRLHSGGSPRPIVSRARTTHHPISRTAPDHTWPTARPRRRGAVATREQSCLVRRRRPWPAASAVSPRVPSRLGNTAAVQSVARGAIVQAPLRSASSVGSCPITDGGRRVVRAGGGRAYTLAGSALAEPDTSHRTLPHARSPRLVVSPGFPFRETRKGVCPPTNQSHDIESRPPMTHDLARSTSRNETRARNARDGTPTPRTTSYGGGTGATQPPTRHDRTEPQGDATRDPSGADCCRADRGASVPLRVVVRLYEGRRSTRTVHEVAPCTKSPHPTPAP